MRRIRWVLLLVARRCYCDGRTAWVGRWAARRWEMVCEMIEEKREEDFRAGIIDTPA